MKRFTNKALHKTAILVLTLAALAFSGCGYKEPEIRVVEKTKIEFIEPYNMDYGYVTTPTMQDNIDNVDTSTSLDMLSEYTLKLQTVVQIYEARMDALREWVDAVKKKQIEASK